MPQERELITVFRTADPDGEDQANAVRGLLTHAGVAAEIFDDSQPGVPQGAREVRVPAEHQQLAERLVESGNFATNALDRSEDLDMVPVFISEANDAEGVALQIRAILDGEGIPSLQMGTSMFPSLPIEVRVPRANLEAANQALAAAREAGPEAAEQAELESEQDSGA